MSTSTVPTGRTKVLLVDDHDLIRKGLRHAFERDRQFEVVGEAGTAAEAVALKAAQSAVGSSAECISCFAAILSMQSAQAATPGPV